MTEALRFRTIVVPFDFSDSARRALDTARSISKSAGPAHLVLVHAYFVPAELETLAQRAHEPILEVVSAQASEDLEKVPHARRRREQQRCLGLCRARRSAPGRARRPSEQHRHPQRESSPHGPASTSGAQAYTGGERRSADARPCAESLENT